MNRSRISSFRFAVLAGAVALCPLVQASAAAATTSNPTPDLASNVASTTSEMDEVIVSGRLDTLSGVRKAIVAAEDRAYARYNELSKERAYDINCRVEAPLHTNLRVRTCEAQYVTDGKVDAARDFLQGHAERTVRLESSGSIVNRHLNELRKRMLKFARTDPEFQRALIERSLLVDRYNMLVKKKFDGHFAVWD